MGIEAITVRTQCGCATTASTFLKLLKAGKCWLTVTIFSNKMFNQIAISNRTRLSLVHYHTRLKRQLWSLQKYSNPTFLEVNHFYIWKANNIYCYSSLAWNVLLTKQTCIQHYMDLFILELGDDVNDSYASRWVRTIILVKTLDRCHDLFDDTFSFNTFIYSEC